MHTFQNNVFKYLGVLTRTMPLWSAGPIVGWEEYSIDPQTRPMYRALHGWLGRRMACRRSGVDRHERFPGGRDLRRADVRLHDGDRDLQRDGRADDEVCRRARPVRHRRSLYRLPEQRQRRHSHHVLLHRRELRPV